VPTENIIYSSLLGFAIERVPTYGNVTFEIVSSYFYLDCNDPILIPFENEHRWTELDFLGYTRDPSKANINVCGNATAIKSQRWFNDSLTGDPC